MQPLDGLTNIFNRVRRYYLVGKDLQRAQLETRASVLYPMFEQIHEADPNASDISRRNTRIDTLMHLYDDERAAKGKKRIYSPLPEKYVIKPSTYKRVEGVLGSL